MYRLTALITLTLTLLALFTGCAPRQRGVEIQKTPAIGADQIQRLALMSTRNIWLAPDEVKRLDSDLAAAISTRYPFVQIIDAATSTAKMDELMLTNEWQSFFDDYQTRGYEDENLIHLLGEALAVDAVLQCEINNAELVDVDKSETGGRGVKVSLSAYMFGSESGELVWSATGEGVATLENESEQNRLMFEAASVAANRLVESLPLK